MPAARRIIGIVGCPGAGKSTLAGRVASSIAGAVVVPMDGFHLAQHELVRLGRADRKGAPDTFDVQGYVSLLHRLRTEWHRTVYAPRFDRHLEEAVAGAIAVEPHHTTVVTEGNYLLHTGEGWESVAPLLDESWYVECDDAVRVARLTDRHIAHGRSGPEAAEWIRLVDEPNALLIGLTRDRADLLIRSDHDRMAFPVPSGGRRPLRPDAAPGTVAAVDLPELQAVIERTYGDRDRARGVPATVAWLCEELGELAQAVRKGTQADIEHEFSDVLAWLATLANQVGVDLATVAARYRDGCPRCSSIPCGC